MDIGIYIYTNIHVPRKMALSCEGTMIYLLLFIIQYPYTIGRWHYPVNGADLVYPGVYLGDAPTALCTRYLKQKNKIVVI